MSQRGAYRQVTECGGPRQSRVSCNDDDGDGTLDRDDHDQKRNDNGIPAPESHIARLYDFTPQRAVPCLSTRSSLLDTPRDPPWIEGRALNAIPRKLCHCSAGLQ